MSLARQGAALAGSAAILAALWLGLHNLARTGWDAAWIFWLPFTLLLATAGGLLCWFAVQGHHATSRRGIAASWSAGALAGGVAFVAGFVLPLIATPGATLGPLMGILVTGPLGFVAGAVGACVVHKLRATGEP